MLRVTRARWLALATALVVVMLAAMFAWLHNVPRERDGAPDPGAAATGAEAAAADPAAIEARRRAFERLACAMCHSIAGRGNPASPLDGIGSRRDAAGIRDWTLATGEARDRLPAGIAGIKSRAAADPEVDALVAYLAQLR